MKIAFPAETVCCFWSSFSQIPSKSSIASRAFLRKTQDQVTTQTLCSNIHVGLTNTQSHQSRVSPDFLYFRSVISAKTHQECVCLHQRAVTSSWQSEYPTCQLHAHNAPTAEDVILITFYRHFSPVSHKPSNSS